MSDTAAAAAVTVVELERIAALGWHGDTLRWRGDWLLRAGGGFTGRANSALVLGPAPDPIDAALDAVERFYTDLDLDPRIALPDSVPGGEPVAVALAGRGWSAGPPVLVMTADLAAVLAGAPPLPGLPAAQLEPVPSAEWLDGYRYRGGRAPSNALPVMVNAERPVFATVLTPSAADARSNDTGSVGAIPADTRSNDTGPVSTSSGGTRVNDPDAVSTRPISTRSTAPLGVARGVVDEGWLGVSAVTVDESRRRRGVGTHLLGELARWAARQGAHSVYLQVDAANEPAVRLYAGRGFVVHHRYTYWSPSD